MSDSVWPERSTICTVFRSCSRLRHECSKSGTRKSIGGPAHGAVHALPYEPPELRCRQHPVLVEDRCEVPEHAVEHVVNTPSAASSSSAGCTIRSVPAGTGDVTDDHDLLADVLHEHARDGAVARRTSTRFSPCGMKSSWCSVSSARPADVGGEVPPHPGRGVEPGLLDEGGGDAPTTGVPVQERGHGDRRSPGASRGTGLSRQSAASIFRCGDTTSTRWYASPVYPIAACSRRTPNPTSASTGSASTRPATQSFTAGAARMYAGDMPRRKPMFCTASAVLT